jgi:hypothetical protein
MFAFRRKKTGGRRKSVALSPLSFLLPPAKER